MEEWERPFEKEDRHNLVKGLNCTLVSGCAFKRPGCTEEWGVKESSSWTLSLTCLWEPQDMYVHSVQWESPTHHDTRTHRNRIHFPTKPSESVVYVIRCCQQMIKSSINTEFLNSNDESLTLKNIYLKQNLSLCSHGKTLKSQSN